MAYAPRVYDASNVLVLDLETIVPDLAEGETGFPKWTRHRPVVASMLSARETQGRWAFALTSEVLDEAGPTRFVLALEQQISTHATIVTANGRGFDAPVIGLLAMATGRFDLPGISSLVRDGRFDTRHADVLELFCNFGGAPKPSLADLCEALAIPAKLEAHGESVASLHSTGDLETIRRYCETDVAATYMVWLHWVALRARKPEQFACPAAAFAVWIERQGLAHLLPYSACLPAGAARAQAPAHLAQRMIEDAEARIRIEQEESRPRGRISF